MMKTLFLNVRIVFLVMAAVCGVAGGTAARAAGRVNPADEIAAALQQARLWDEKEDEAAAKILAFFYGKAAAYEKAGGGEGSLLAAAFYSLTAQTLWEYYRSYGAVEDFREGLKDDETPIR